MNFETAGGERASATASDSPGIKLDIYIHNCCVYRKEGGGYTYVYGH